jgi:hypothetical protein
VANPGYVNLIDISKTALNWQRIYLTATLYNTTVEVVLVNDRFVPPPVLGFDIFNNGIGGSPSRPNAGLAQSGTIRLWTQLNGVNATVPFAELTVTATLADGSSAMQFVNVNRIWNNQGYVNMIDVNANGQWDRIYLTAVLFDTVVEIVLVNANYQPVVPQQGAQLPQDEEAYEDDYNFIHAE